MQKISLCSNDEIGKLRSFLHKNWSENHILAVNEELMDFQHKSKEAYNFVISKNEDEEITGLLGFIPVHQFDNSLIENNDIWLAIWKVDENIAEPGIGFSLLKWLIKHFKPRSIGAIGINSNVARIYNLLGYTTGVLNQYYFLNPNSSEYRILSNDLLYDSPRPDLDKSDSSLKLLSDEIESLDIVFNTFPKKSRTYIENRYLRHPYYDYMIYGAYNKSDLEAVFVIRKILAEGSSCLRIVDVIGEIEEIGSLKHSLIDILSFHNAEFVDCLNYGVSKEIFQRCGFKLRDESIVIPNYFEPYVNKNVDIQFAYKTDRGNYIIYKGDSDQDRPSLIK